MKHLGRNPETEGTEEPSGFERRNFLRRAGVAAALVGGLEALGVAPAMAAIRTKSASAGPTRKLGAVYPQAGKPGPHTKSIVITPECSCDITWYCTPGDCDGPCKSPSWCYFWHDSCNGSSGGPVCAWSNCATHVQCI